MRMLKRENSFKREMDESQANIAHLLNQMDFEISPFEGRDLEHMKVLHDNE
jgi:hypothetical protein